MFLLIFLHALLAATFSIGKVLVAYFSPLFLVSLRMIIGGIALLSIQYYTRYHRWYLNPEHWKIYVQSAVFGIVIPYWLRYTALTTLCASHAACWYTIAPLITYMLSVIILKELIMPSKVVALLCNGIAFFFVARYSTAEIPTYKIVQAHGYLLVATLSSSYNLIILRTCLKNKYYAPAMINGITMLLGGLIALLVMVATSSPLIIQSPPLVYSGVLLIILIVLSNMIGHTAYTWFLQWYSPTLLSLASFLSPLFMYCYELVWLHKSVDINFIIALFWLFLSLMIFYKAEFFTSYRLFNFFIKNRDL